LRAIPAPCEPAQLDTALYNLYKDGRVSLEEALNNADSKTNLEAKINFG